jgi:hypothetical protein
MLEANLEVIILASVVPLHKDLMALGWGEVGILHSRQGLSEP